MMAQHNPSPERAPRIGFWANKTGCG